jgi:hypothetical protein
MKQKHIILSACLIIASQGFAQSWPTAAPEAKPGARWWWLGSAVNEKDLRWNMQEYAKAGIGSLEITPLYGVQGNASNELQFLSTPWMNALRFVQEEGAKNGILIDMNNGTGWPFGGPTTPISEAAAKLVCTDTTVTGKQLRKGINISIKDTKEKPYAQLSKVMAYTETGAIDLTGMADSQGFVMWKNAPKNKIYRLIAAYCSRTRQKVKRAAPGGEGYVLDHFDKQAVANYLKRFETAFDKSGVPYPHNFFNDSYEVYGANWTPTLFDEFAKRRGYKLEEHLLELLGEKDDEGNRVLSDYRETLSDMLLENFTEQWADWAHRHRVEIRNQAHGSPANLIDLYSAVDVPEIEGFGLSEFGIKGLRKDPGFTKKNDSDVSMLKYASSSAHINGKPYTSSETFTWLTEHFRTSLSQMKPDMDLMFTCGVNHMFFHGTCYSPQNDQWPGWKFYASVDMSPTNSIWHDAPYMMKYIERSQSFLQMGKPDNDFIVLLPVRDMWAERRGKGTGSLLMQFDIHSMDKKAPQFIKSILDIDKAGFDCDYISEKYLLTTTFTNGMLQTAAGTRYKALIIPGSGRMPANVLKHINDLKEQGAKIIYGTDSREMNAITKPEAMRYSHGLRAIRRKNDTGYHYFIANLTPNDVDARIPLAVNMKDARWFNPIDGAIYAADFTDDGIQVSLKSGESMILQTYDMLLAEKAPLRKSGLSNPKVLDGKWTLNFIESAPRVEKTFALEALQTWENLDDDSVKITMGIGAYTTRIKMTKQEALKNWAIDLGDVRESARVYINEQFIGCAWAVPYILDCKQAFKAGDNSIRIEVTNLPANRIADLDRKGVNWRKFNEINIVDINYKKTGYEQWLPMKSGLNSKVTLYNLN